MKINWPIFLLPEEEAEFGREAGQRLRRLRALAWFLDRSFSIAGRHFGFDPLIGLIPAVGDWIGGVLSLYILYEAARLGIKRTVLLRMLWNITVDTLLGILPVVGDWFDFVWQANAWNIELVEEHLNRDSKLRPPTRIFLGIFLVGAFLFAFSAAIGGVFVYILWKLIR